MKNPLSYPFDEDGFDHGSCIPNIKIKFSNNNLTNPRFLSRRMARASELYLSESEELMQPGFEMIVFYA